MSPKTSITVCVVVVLVCLSVAVSQTLPSTNSSGSTEKMIDDVVDSRARLRQEWILTDKALKAFMGRFIRITMPTVLREVYTRNVSSDCLSGLLSFGTALRKIQLWAFKMIDASGKLPEGLLSGTLTMLGNYRECIDIAVREKKANIKGQYCTVNVVPPLPEWRSFLSLHQRVPELVNVSSSGTVIDHLASFAHNLLIVPIKIGLCVPSMCSAQDTHNLVQIIPERTGLNWKFSVDRCETKTAANFTQIQTAVLYIFGVVSLLLLLGTIADFAWNEDNLPKNDIIKTTIQVLRAFSVTSNLRKLADYEPQHQKTRFVHGVMFLAIGWIIFANTFMYVNYDIASNFEEALRIVKMTFYEVFLHRIVPLQTLFFLSGFISAHKVMSGGKSMSVWKYIVKRYCRYTPQYALVIGLVMLIPTWGSGPSWQSHVTPIYNKCRDTWWANILYINNLVDAESVCLDHTWALAVDAQLHLVGLIVLLLLRKHPKIGLGVNFLLIAASLLTVALTNVHYELPPNEMTAFLNDRDRSYYAEHSYYRVYTHLCLYCAGIATGYYVAKNQRCNLPKVTCFFLWVATGTGALATLCSVHVWSLGILPSPLEAALYAAFGKTAWAVLLAWTTVYCCFRSGSMLNVFLSWRPFAFTSRLMFLTYLLHPVLIQVLYGLKKSHIFVEQFEVLYVGFSHVAPSFLLAAMCHLCFEAPFLSLTQLIQKKTRSRRLTDPSLPYHNDQVLTEKPVRFSQRKQDNETQE